MKKMAEPRVPHGGAKRSPPKPLPGPILRLYAGGKEILRWSRGLDSLSYLSCLPRHLFLVLWRIGFPLLMIDDGSYLLRKGTLYWPVHFVVDLLIPKFPSYTAPEKGIDFDAIKAERIMSAPPGHILPNIHLPPRVYAMYICVTKEKEKE